MTAQRHDEGEFVSPPPLPHERLVMLNDEQVNGIACVYCGAAPARMVPVGDACVGCGRQWVCCLPLCEPARELLRER
jgi:hypothetical protein